MSHIWADRQRRTNRLVRIIASHVLKQKDVTAEQLYGLSKLTWVTNSFDDDNSKYIASTKLPALGSALSCDYNGWSLPSVARDISSKVGSSDVEEAVLAHTGFTNFYMAYRNSCRKWLETHLESVRDIFARALVLKTDNEGLFLAKKVAALPPVPKANVANHMMKPEYLMTPVLFALDARIRFPLINGNEGVKSLLASLDATNAPLETQYERMISLIGHGGIRDAADLDQIGQDLPDFIKVGKKPPTKKLLEEKEVEGNNLPLKDETDVESLQVARTLIHRRLHNVITNTTRAMLARFTLLEGCDADALFDVLVKNYDANGNDLLIEAKSSVDRSHMRMAVGQLFDYWFRLKGECAPHLAVLTPERPSHETCEMLNWLNIGVLWIDGEKLKTCTDRLRHLCSQ